MIQHGESNNNEQAKNVTTCVAVFPVQPTTVDVLEQSKLRAPVSSATILSRAGCISPCVTVKSAMNRPKSSHGWRISVRRLTMEERERNLQYLSAVRSPASPTHVVEETRKKANRRTLEHFETPSTDLENMV